VTTLTKSPAARARTSTIVLKIAMALTGLVFIGYVLVHMYGNLKVFAGQEAFDDYAHHLRVFGEPILPENGLLWIVRVVLLVSLLVHAGTAFQLWARAQGARSTKYVRRKAVVATLSSRTMRWGGVALLLFVVFHILHLTTRTITPGGDFDSPYQRMVNGFSPEQWWVAVIYLLAMVALGMHLRHGIWSAAQTLGLTNTPVARARFNALAYVVAIVVAVGFALVPLSVLFGIVE
jgi:succinate dehydrogenase / fumarate reductase, cytochrome b subunit